MARTGEGLALGAMSVLGHDLVDRAAIGVQLVLKAHRLQGRRLDAFPAWVSVRVASASGEAAELTYRNLGRGVWCPSCSGGAEVVVGTA